MSIHAAWLLIVVAAFGSGAWWQFSGCKAKLLAAQERVLKDDAKAVEKLKPKEKERAREHIKFIEVVKTSPDACLREQLPAAVAQRLRIRSPGGP